MALTTTREMLGEAYENHFAVGAFNVENMEMLQAVIAAAEAAGAPVIVQTTPGTLRYAPPKIFAGMAERLARDAKVPVALHLDHGDSYELAQTCVREGYTSLMIDGSHLPLEENIALTRRVVEMARGLPVEAELGTVGGKEDDRSARLQYTEPAEAERFVRETGVFSFAPAIGTAHGVYRAEPKLDLERLRAIRDATGIPLVLHGTSGVPHEVVRRCIAYGVCKVNYATELRIAFSDAVRQYLTQKPAAIDPKKYSGAGRDAVQKRVGELIVLLGSGGKA
jgi:tagatose 1,6-diphosphate aldolase GatY/KbaY